MITENCDKYIKKVKYGGMVFLINLLLVIVAKSGYFSSEMVENNKLFIILILIISFIVITVLINPYFVCLSKYKKH